MENNKLCYENDIHLLFKYIPKKLLLYLTSIEYDFSNNIYNPPFKLISDLHEINFLLKTKKIEVIKYFYFSRNKIFPILYNYETNIIINFEEKKKCLFYNFYLNLLIMENTSIIYFSYSIKYIREINNEIKNITNKYKLIIMSKIINDLIYNFKGDINYTESDNYELDLIANENKKIIRNNIHIFEEINLLLNEQNIKEQNIDDIYIQIIIALIKSKKIEDYDYTYNIIKELDLENIDITENMLDKLIVILNSNEINNYKIIKKEDLFEEKKINFYFILLKYILKSSIYNFQIPFLLQTRKLIIALLKTNELFNDININKIIENKIDYIIINMTDLDYYSRIYYKYKYSILKKNEEKSLEEDDFEKYVKNNNNIKDKILKKYNNKNYFDIMYKTFFNNNYLDLNLKSFQFEYYANQILNKSSILLYSNKNEINPGIRFGLITLGNFDIKINYKKLLNCLVINESKDSYLIKNYIRFINFLEKVKEKINNEFIYNYNLKILLEFEREREDNIVSIYNITCIYTFYSPLDNKEIKFKEYNILIDETNSISQTFQSLLLKINDKSYKYLSFFKSDSDLISSSYKSINKNEERSFSTLIKFNNIEDELTNEIIGKYRLNSKYLKELSNGYYINWGNEKNNIYIYDIFFEKKIVINGFKNLNNSIIDIFEKNIKETPTKELVLIIFSRNNKFRMKINLNTLNYHIEKIHRISDMDCKKIIKIDKNNYLYIFENNYTFPTGHFINSIKINDDVIVLSSNSIIKGGENILIFYDINKKKKLYEIFDFSFSLYLNCFALIENKRIDHNLVLLCVCQKYFCFQKNGILLIIINNKAKIDEPLYKFYDTKTFKIDCICPLKKIDNNNKIFINTNDAIITSTEYFLVGGSENNKGKIKLFKVLFHDNIKDTEISYIKEIIFNEQNILQSSISSITQLKRNNNILVSCNDGNSFLFDILNNIYI